MNPMYRTFIPASVLLAGVLLISGIREQFVTPPRAPLTTLPAEFLGVSSKDTVVSADEQRVAGMSHYLMRMFHQDSVFKFSIYVGYYDRQVQGKSIHSPKNCLPGAGFEIMTSERAQFQAAGREASVNRVLLGNNGTRVLVYYWYQGRGRIEPSEYKVKWDLLRDAALYGRTEEALVRIVVPVDRNGGDAAVASADSVARKIVPDLITAVYGVLPASPRA